MLGRQKQLRASMTNWEAIRDVKVHEEEIHTVIDLRRLEEQRGVLEDRKAAAERKIATAGESEAGVRAHRVLARQWIWLTLLAVGIAFASAWWSASWFLTLSWEKWLLAVSIVALPLIGWDVFLKSVGEQALEWDLRKVFAGLGFVVVLCGTAAAVSLGGARMFGVELQEEQREARQLESEGDAASDVPRVGRRQVESTKRLLNGLSVVAVVLLGIAGEVAAGLAWHELKKHLAVATTAGSFYRERHAMLAALAVNAATQEAVRRRPEILRARLTAEGLEEEAAAQQAADAHARQMRSVVPTMRWIAIGIVGLLALLVAASVAFGAPAVPEATVIILDLSDSVRPSEEFDGNLHVVDAAIRHLPAGGARFTVLGLDEASFGRGPLLAATSPREAGRFGEYLDDWRSRTLRSWEKRAVGLKPIARGSDVIGALGRAALEFEEVPGAKRRLLILSDMRQVGRGLNFEKPIGEPRQIVERLTREGMIPGLKGVEVWALGVDTRGIEESHWRRLKAFWVELFKAAGADLKAYSPNRRLPER